MAQRAVEDPHPHMDLDDNQHHVFDMESYVRVYAITQVHGL
jgi:hypothetical protein